MTKKIEIKSNIIDKAIDYIAPVQAARRLKARVSMAIANTFIGASKSRRQTSGWMPSKGDADADLNFDLPTLRERSRDLVRNNPIGGGVISSNCTNIVGSGLKLYSRIDREVLGMDENSANAWEAITEREFRLWSESYNSDVARILNFPALQNQALRQVFENGDVGIIPARRKLPGWPYSLCLQIIEADRISNKNNTTDRFEDNKYFSAGVEKDVNGTPINYYVCNAHPGSATAYARKTEWATIPAFSSKTGLKNFIHLFDQKRPGQTRGIPYLAPVIEALKQIGKYTDAELTAAVLAACFTVFIKSERGEGLTPDTSSEVDGKTTDEGYKIAPGAIMAGKQGDEVQIINPGRPNATFDPFVIALLKQIGLALEIPFEVLIKYFSSSYSAARASLLEAWRFYRTRRAWLIQNLCQVVYEIWMYEAILLGRIIAPGFFDDIMIRKAYLGSSWVGPSQGQIDPTKEVSAAQARVDGMFSTIEAETAELTGEDLEHNLPQIRREMAIKKELGIIKEPAQGAANNQGAAA